MLHISPFRQVLIVLTCMVGLALAVPNLFYDRVEHHNDAVAAIDNGLSNEALEADAALWPSFLPSGLVNLGLDLRGGAHLLAEVQVADVYASTMESMWPDVRDVLNYESEPLLVPLPNTNLLLAYLRCCHVYYCYIDILPPQ